MGKDSIWGNVLALIGPFLHNHMLRPIVQMGCQLRIRTMDPPIRLLSGRQCRYVSMVAVVGIR
jgi:hypothetical protein